jgi:hypothetical protein
MRKKNKNKKEDADYLRRNLAVPCFKLHVAGKMYVTKSDEAFFPF